MYQNLAIEHQGPVATVWLNRPDVHNAFDETVIAELDAAVQRLADDPQVRVVVLAGRGRNFCAGADLHWMRRAAAATAEENLRDARAFAAMLQRLAGLAKPTIACVQGAALGGGMGLVAACDIAVAADDASFAMTEVRLGLIPAVIGPYVIRALGARAALRYMLTAERLSAVQAVHLGLLHEAVPAAQLATHVATLAVALCAGGPQSQAAAKDLVARLAATAHGPDTVELTARAIAQQRGTAEAREGLEAFFGRRAAAWLPPA